MSSDQDCDSQITTHSKGLWIPVELERLGLSFAERALLAIIDNLDGGAPKYCWATNKYLAERMEISESRVSFYITKLKRMKLIEQVSFTGRRRRLKCLKSNWYKEENSKKELCVKASRQTTRKQVGRLRESTQASPYIEDIEEEIVDKAMPSNADSMPHSNKENSAKKAMPPVSRKKKLSEEQEGIIAWIELQDLPKLEYDSIVYWACNYSLPRIKDAFCALEIAKKSGTIRNPAGFIRSILDGKIMPITEDVLKNKEYAQNVAQRFKISDWKFHQKYMIDLQFNHEIPFTVTRETFKEMISNLLKQRGS